MNNLWVGTFHGLAHRLLRRHWREAGLPQTFQILDSEDQQRLIRRLLKGLELDENTWVPREIQWFINNQKDEGRRPEQLQDEGDYNRRQMIHLYRVYQDACERSGLVDFAELLLRAHELWAKNPELLATYRRRFQHVLVDEFQDTNAIQYSWLRLLAGETGIPFAVGDDDQSIYRWRGARTEHLSRFRQDFPGTRIVKLEQNYRSTGTILKAANALIAHNQGRIGKELWTESGEGTPIRLFSAYNEREEAEFIIERIRSRVAQGNRRADAAVLYRSNAQSRVFEEALLHVGMPYRVYGGLRFFERAEIKDALAYLRLLANRDDDPSFERVVNLPARGIGARTVDEIRSYARANAISLWRSAQSRPAASFPGRAAKAVFEFLALVDAMDRDTAGPAAARAGGPRGPAERPHRALPEGGAGPRRGPHREPGGTGQRRPQLRSRGSGTDDRRGDDPARRLPRPCRARIRRRRGRGLGRLRAAHDHALRQGTGVSRGVHRRHGGRALPPPAHAARIRTASRRSGACVTSARRAR